MSLTGDTFDFQQGNVVTSSAQIVDNGATVGDVLTVQADKSIAAAPGGGSQPYQTFPVAFNTAGFVNPADNGVIAFTLDVGDLASVAVMEGAFWDVSGDVWVTLAADASDPDPWRVGVWRVISTGSPGTSHLGLEMTTADGQSGGSGTTSILASQLPHLAIVPTGKTKIAVAFYPDSDSPTRGTATIVVTTTPAA